MAASLDCLGTLPAPWSGSVAADLLEASAFAYAAGTAVAVCEVQRLHVVAMLLGAHRAPITSVKWCPTYHSRQLGDPNGQIRLASGDAEGSVVVWEVGTASPAARLEDVPTAREVVAAYLSRYSSSSSSSEGAAGTGGGAAAGGGGAASASAASAASAGAAVGAASGAGVSSLAWVMPGHSVLAVVLAPALLLLWDVNSGALLSKRELGPGSELFSQLTVDPLDSRQLCLCGSNGAVAVLRLNDPAAAGDRGVQLRQYRVNLQQQAADSLAPKSPSSAAAAAHSSSSSRLQALFTVCRGLLVLLLPRELLLFDTQLGAPAASTVLPHGMAAFVSLLGVWGSGVCQGGGDDGGVDFLYALHGDGGLSVWVRVPGELRFKLGCVATLLPPPLRASGQQVSLCAVKAALWWRQQGPAAASSSSSAATAAGNAQTAASTARITEQLSSSLGSSLASAGGVGLRQTGGNRHGGNKDGSNRAASHSSSNNSSGATLSGRCLLVCAVTSDSRVWQWELQVPAYPQRSLLTDAGQQPNAATTGSMLQASKAAAVPAAVLPQLVGLLHTLPGGLTTIALQPCPLLLPTNKPHHQRRSSQTAPVAGAAGTADCAAAANDAAAAAAAAECVLVGAGPTSTGALAVFTVRRGLINPLCPELLSALSAHREAAKGVRWLGPQPLLVSFSSERSSSSKEAGWRNTLLITDIHTGHSVPFRDSAGSESCPLVGIRVSPSGAYILLLFKGAPAELWTPLPSPVAVVGAAAASAASSSSAADKAGMLSGSSSSKLLAQAGGAGGVAAGPGGASDSTNSTPAAASAGAGASGAVSSCSLVKPWRVRLVDLPFSAVEWIGTEEDMHKDEVYCWGECSAVADAAAAAGDGGGPSSSAGGAGGAASDASSREPWRVERQDSTGGGLRQPSYLSAPSMSAPAAGGGSAGGGIGGVSAADAAGAAGAAAGAAAGVSGDPTQPHFPFELLAFSLTDGRSGVLSFRGRKVHDLNPKRPSTGPGPHSLSLVSAVAGVWPLMLLGDAEGTLMAWDLLTGRCSSIATGLGVVRRLQLGPASPPVLSGAAEAALSGAATARGSGVERLRAAVLFGSGQVNVYDLDAVGRIRPGGVVSSAAASRLGAVKDIGWLALPSPAGGGSFLAAVTQDGSLSLLDVAQPLAVRPQLKARTALTHKVLSTHSTPAAVTFSSDSSYSSSGEAAPTPPTTPAAAAVVAVAAPAVVRVPVVLLGPGALGSSMLLKQPWVLLLRFLLQAGVAQDSLLYISSSSSSSDAADDADDDAEVRQELQQLLPRSAQAVLAHIASTSAAAETSVTSALSRLQLEGSAGAAAATPGSSTQPPAPSQQQQQQAGTAGGSARGVPRQVHVPAHTPGRTLWGVDAQHFKGDLLQLLREISQLRGCRQLLLPNEWCAYTEALQSGQLSRRMAVAARLSGHTAEAAFWTALPATLAHIKTLQEAIQQRQQMQELTRRASLASAAAAAGGGGGGSSSNSSSVPARPPETPTAGSGTPRVAAAAAASTPTAAADGAAAAAAGAALDAAAAAAAAAADGDADNADDGVVDASDYDFMVQQALEGSSMGAAAAAATHGSTAAAAAANMPHSPAAAGGSSLRPAPSAAAAAGAAGVSSPLGRRGSGAAVPGRVLYRGGGQQQQQQQFSGQGPIRQAAHGRPVRLWDEELVLSEAQEVLMWHEALPVQDFAAADAAAAAAGAGGDRGQQGLGEGGDAGGVGGGGGGVAGGLLERRLLEYTVLGDFATAVAFLLSTPPESSVRYYRSVVCALALAATASLQAQGSSSSTSQAAATLHLQAAKVVSAHASSIGDNLLGVPLNCSAGLNADAVQLLQEAGMWQAAAALTARTLTGTERAQALSRWASHVRLHEASVWRCVGILTAAGCLQAAAQVLRSAGLPDCAYAYVQACQEAGLVIPQQQQQQQQQQGGSGGISSSNPTRQSSSTSSSLRAQDDGDDSDDDDAVFGSSSGSGRGELFDILGLRTRMLLQASNSRAALAAGGGGGGGVGGAGGAGVSAASSGADLLALISSEYQQYLCDLVRSL